MNPKFVVTILTTNVESGDARDLSLLFPKSKYKVRIEECIPPLSLVDTENYSAQQQAETLCIDKILSMDKQKYPDCYSLIIKDTSVTVSTPEQIYQLLIQATQQSGWELFYLTKWLDRCDLYKNPQEIKNRTYSFINTFSPNGFQAIMLSPKGRDVILGEIPMKNGRFFPPVTQPIEVQLNENISAGNITAISTIPNIFEYDVNKATTEEDYLKGTLCSPESIEGRIFSRTDPTPLSFIWYVIVIIMIILAAIAFWYLTGGNSNEINNRGSDKESSRSSMN